jgi:hypothetical protein
MTWVKEGVESVGNLNSLLLNSGRLIKIRICLSSNHMRRNV